MKTNYKTRNGEYLTMNQEDKKWLKKNEKYLPQMDFKKKFGEDKVFYFEDIKFEEN